MRPIRFIHAADCHLDAAFSGLGTVNASLQERLYEATFTALRRLFDLCIEKKVDFLLIAGDISNAEDHSIKAQFALYDGCKRLKEHNIAVYIIHGNHDPISSRLQAVPWPDNVTFFGKDLEEKQHLNEQGHLLALIHGISYASNTEKRNLAKYFKRNKEFDCPQIGLLHSHVGAIKGKHLYAPCTLDDLKKADMDYFALGHIHKREILSDSPPIAYPGCIQGLHILEEGEKGCFLVSLEKKAHSQSFEHTMHFHALAPIVWQNIYINLESLDDPNCPHSLDEAVQKALEEAKSSLKAPCESLLVRLHFTGRSPLHEILQKPENLEDLLEQYNTQYADGQKLWIKDIQLASRPPINKETLSARKDLSGEIHRLVATWQEDPESLEACRLALRDFYNHKQAKKMLENLTDDELISLLSEAESMCLNSMESS